MKLIKQIKIVLILTLLFSLQIFTVCNTVNRHKLTNNLSSISNNNFRTNYKNIKNNKNLIMKKKDKMFKKKYKLKEIINIAIANKI